MMIRFLIGFFFALVFVVDGHAQQTCVLKFSYVGEVSLKTWKVGSVIVPTASYLLGRTQEDDIKSNHGANIQDGSFKADLTTDPDILFCGDLEKVIQQLQSKRKTIPVTFVEQKTDHAARFRQVTIEVSIEKIQFVPVGEPRQIIINLPPIKE